MLSRFRRHSCVEASKINIDITIMDLNYLLLYCVRRNNREIILLSYDLDKLLLRQHYLTGRRNILQCVCTLCWYG